MKTVIQDAWLEYERMVVPKEADDTQRAEMRGAFVAGMFNFNMILMSAVGDADVNNEIAETKVMNLNLELEKEIMDYREAPTLSVYRERNEVVHE